MPVELPTAAVAAREALLAAEQGLPSENTMYSLYCISLRYNTENEKGIDFKADIEHYLYLYLVL